MRRMVTGEITNGGDFYPKNLRRRPHERGEILLRERTCWITDDRGIDRNAKLCPN